MMTKTDMENVRIFQRDILQACDGAEELNLETKVVNMLAQACKLIYDQYGPLRGHQVMCDLTVVAKANVAEEFKAKSPARSKLH